MKMKRHILPVLPAALLAAACAWGQDTIPRKSDPGMKIPSDPGMARPRGSSEKPAAPTGKVVVPPATDSEAVAKPPENVDPGIKAQPPANDGSTGSDESRKEDAAPAQRK
ncbi:hypothetical protein [Noviherbaspirillum massiliense]|uniref:hypothetical protein n=1 Tax=Noviherbaspirillum massiliense TaxID=1465823 RepID=UPI0002E0896B|nr:hypothetical protein [Noviherbaspirillum massiliense]